LGRALKVAPSKDGLGMSMIMVQVVGALIGIIIGARFFVEEVEAVADAVGIPSIILAFLIAPIATELPEKFNSVIWYWRGKDTLALGNITGAMVFQSSFPVSIGLLFTEWALEPINIASMVIALVAASWIYYSVKVKKRVEYRTLLASGSLYILYIIMLVLFL
jgi:cation:H+ antiporter